MGYGMEILWSQGVVYDPTGYTIHFDKSGVPVPLQGNYALGGLFRLFRELQANLVGPC